VAQDRAEEAGTQDKVQDEWEDFLQFISSEVEKKAVEQTKTQMRKVDRLVSDLLRTIVSKRKISEDELKAVLHVTVEKFVEAVQAQAVTIYFTDEEGNIGFDSVYYSPSLYGSDPALKDRYIQQAQALKTKKLRSGQGIVGKVIETGKPHMAENAYKDPDFFKEVDKRTGFVSRSLITVPIKVGDKVLGAFQAVNKNPETGMDVFTQRDFSLLQEIADYSSKIIQKARFPQTPIGEVEMAQYLARLTKCEFVDLDEDFDVNEKLIKTIGEEPIKRYKILPLKKVGNKSLKVAMANPLELQRRDSFQLKTGMDIEIVVVSPASQIDKIIENVSQKGKASGVAQMLGEEYASKAEEVKVEDGSSEESAPIIQLANRIVEDAYSRGASDVHIEPFEKDVLVRYRVDGVLHEELRLPRQALAPLISRYKIMSELDITERRLPQDGRIKFKYFTKTNIDIDLRVAIAPMSWGEKVVMRILDKSATQLGLDAMGFSQPNLDAYRWTIRQPYGMILHVGPTGSGKTTTLYAALTEVNKPEINIQTAEDPVEYMLHGINQLQVHKNIGLTFAAALRSYLRQDPDIIMVGEIRDRETAEMAIEAALTGHLMFSTLHTNDAVGTVVRFLDMGIQPFLVSSSLLGVVAQRLMRRLCTKCKEPYDATEEELSAVRADKPVKLFKAPGCSRCGGTGFKGRIGVHEVLRPNDEIKTMINKVVPSEELKRVAVASGMITLYEDAMDKVRQGISSLEEALRVVREE
jgi:type IV pilus assembly protein PilB